jgi:hypothetical protein
VFLAIDSIGLCDNRFERVREHSMPITVDTAHGYTVAATCVGIEYQVETTNARGEVIANVRMSEDRFRTLWDDMANVAGFVDEAAFDNGYDQGYAAGRYDEWEAF